MRIGLLSFAAAAAGKTENFYENGLENISNDFEAVLENVDIRESTKSRYIKKIKNFAQRIQAKHDKLGGLDGITFPALDGDLEFDGSSDVDVTKTCEAIDLIQKDLKNWATYFVEAAVRECDGDRCFTPNEGPLSSFQTHQNWHNNNNAWVEKFYEKVDLLIKKTRMAVNCGKYQIFLNRI